MLVLRTENVDEVSYDYDEGVWVVKYQHPKSHRREKTMVECLKVVNRTAGTCKLYDIGGYTMEHSITPLRTH